MRANQERKEELPAAECQRMLSLVAAPLLPPHQLAAIFAAFDTNLDGEISPDELHNVLRMLNPIGRYKEVQALAPRPPPPGLAKQLGERTAEQMRRLQSAAEPCLKQLGALALQVGGLAGTEAPEGGGGHGDAGGGSGGGRDGDGGGDGDGDGEDGGGDNGGDGDEGEVGAKATKDGDGSPTRESTSVAQGLDFRRAGNMLVKAFGSGTAAAGGDGEEREEGGGLQRKWRRRRKVKRTAFDTNQRLAEQWQAVAPNFAYA